MQGRDDVAGFIAGFAGDDRYIVDYLVEEVLHRQPETVRSFLLETSILDRLTGPLCDAVTGQARRHRPCWRRSIEANLFLVPLDDRRQLVPLPPPVRRRAAGAPAGRAARHGAGAAPAGQRVVRGSTASASEAIRHAMAGGDVARAADLVELAWPATGQNDQAATLRRWLEALPDELIRVRPVLSVAYAATLLVGGKVEGVEARLRDAERWLDTPADGRAGPKAPSTAMVVVDEEEFRRLPCSIALYRAAQALAVGDVAGTMTHARRALDLVGEDDHPRRGAAAGLLGLVSWTTGDLEAAHRLYADCHSEHAEGGARHNRHWLRHHPGRHPDRPGSAPRRTAHLRAGIAGCDRTWSARAAGGGGHAHRHERAVSRAQRPRGRVAAPRS